MGHVRVLDLNGRSITSAMFSDLPLPPVETLEELDLSHNKLTWINEGIGGFTSLRKLSLAYNDITFVHDALWRLTRIETLDLSYNRIDYLGDGIEALLALQTLDLRGNPLSMTPALERLADRGCLVLL